MKKIKTNNYKKIKADLVEHPPIVDEKENTLYQKKKKKIYQLNKEVDSIDSNI